MHTTLHAENIQQATPQSRMKARLAQAGIPFKDIEVYGSQIVITSHSRKTAERWAMLLARRGTVRGITENLDYAQKQKGTVLVPTVVKTFRTFATV